jgi:3-oxoacyl-[acyl-carrier protein] reductase
MEKYLIITGGSRGIGASTIQRFAEDGWQVINLSRTPSNYPNVLNIAVDLTVPKSIDDHATQLSKHLQPAAKICLVHNAAYYQRDSLDTLPLDNLYFSLEMNIVSPVILTQLLLPFMSPGSSIIYIGSTLAEKAVPGSASYIISKHALVGLMKATCQDLIGRQIHTVCVNPGLVDTALLKETMNTETINFLLENKIIGKRLIKPEEIAKLIHFLAGTPLMNGINIAANTGQVAE